MSEPRLIEPLLSDCIMGEPISDRCGVRCCPAMHNETEEKYIVKILSIPAGKKQLAALILSGACRDAQDAQRYFKELADEAVSEAELLQKLSRLEGFRAYDSWQVEPMEDGPGFDVYLRAPYGQTLERYLRRSGMTHLAAVNLGLDLCAALSVCRRNGCLYVDLKPENIYLSDNQGYLIGDLGFIRLSSLKYASLPDKYRSPYTAPEIQDAYSSLNDTLDIYALGLILYQVYNNGQLPPEDEPMTPPEYADYEMAEIILKACADDPADRWMDPQELAQALVSYMQRNTVNDDPIIPPPVPAQPVIPDEPETGEADSGTADEASGSAEEEPETPGEEPATAADEPEIPEQEHTKEEIPEVEDCSGEIPEEEPPVEDSAEKAAEEPAPVEEAPAVDMEEPEQIMIEGFLFDDTLPDEENIEDLQETEVSDEVSQMLAQADELIAHKAPDPVVAPEAIEIPMPDPILPEPEEAPAEEPQEESTPEEPLETPAPIPETAPEEEAKPVRSRPKVKWGWLIAILIAGLLLGGGAYFGREYYENVYLQHIDSITLDSAQDWLTVILDTDIDNSLLTVVCTDTYGGRLTSPVTNNRATFSDLPSGMSYKITVTISGRHQLTGDTTASYTTPNQTSIIGLTGVIGDTDGSVILSFSVQGPDASSWLVKYEAEGEPEKTAACTGHMAMITGLTPGKTYSFRLVPQEDLYVVSGDSLEFTATNVAYAENLTVHGFDQGALVVTWEPRAGEVVESWTVRCYNAEGTDLSFTVTEPQIAIAGLNTAQGYTVEVTAAGMTVSRVTGISAGSVSFKDILMDGSVPGELSVSWNYEGSAPEGGWTVVYTVDGSGPITITCEKNSFVLTDLVPGGHYTFDITLPSGTTYFGSTTASWDCPEAESFSGYGASAEYMLFYLCLAPEYDGWTWQDVPTENYTSDFASADRAGIVIRLTEEYETSPDLITVTYVIRDENGVPVSLHKTEQTWTSMWYQGYCELTLPALPSTAGTYTLEIYLNGAYITATPISFTVS